MAEPKGYGSYNPGPSGPISGSFTPRYGYEPTNVRGFTPRDSSGAPTHNDAQHGFSAGAKRLSGGILQTYHPVNGWVPYSGTWGGKTYSQGKVAAKGSGTSSKKSGSKAPPKKKKKKPSSGGSKRRR